MHLMFQAQIGTETVCGLHPAHTSAGERRRQRGEKQNKQKKRSFLTQATSEETNTSDKFPFS